MPSSRLLITLNGDIYVKYLILYLAFNKMTVNSSYYFRGSDGDDGKQDEHQERPDKKANEKNNAT